MNPTSATGKGSSMLPRARTGEGVVREPLTRSSSWADHCIAGVEKQRPEEDVRPTLDDGGYERGESVQHSPSYRGCAAIRAVRVGKFWGRSPLSANVLIWLWSA